MNYEEARAFIEEANAGIHPGLSRMEKLLALLGSPEKYLKIIHVAGTNGKGSILAFVSTVLTHAGYRVGRYISPTLYDYLERFQINGIQMNRDVYITYVLRLKKAVEEMAASGFERPSPFELETALSFLYFRDSDCDFVALECGMGGRGDATNVIPAPLVSVFASISMDHMQFLGNTVEEIAWEKAGIIKKGSICVSAPQSEAVRAVLMQVCREQGVPYFEPDPQKYVSLVDTIESQRFSYCGENYEIHLPGACQKDNVMTAITVLQVLKDSGLMISQDALQNGLEQTIWEGRFSRLSRHPDFLVDGAHNPAAAQKLRDSILKYYPNKRRIFIMGVFSDKAYCDIIKITCDLADTIYTIATPGNLRALPAEELAKAIRASGTGAAVYSCSSPEEAVDQAFAGAADQDVIISFGSLSNIGEITEYLRNLTLNHS